MFEEHVAEQVPVLLSFIQVKRVVISFWCCCMELGLFVGVGCFNNMFILIRYFERLSKSYELIL